MISETAIFNGNTCLNPNKPNQDFFEPIINMDEFINLREGNVRVSKGFLRDEIDALIEQGIDIKPEYLSDPVATGLLQKRMAAQEADKD